ncbi:MAG: hypothetical protein KGL77_06025 [Actinomycetales bacterium]|nr:hypothetical protein [Actinomycetales bacterium]
MPKRSKPRKPAANRNASGDNYSPSPRELRRKKIVRGAAFAVVFALIATFLIGALAGTPAKAAERVGAGSESSPVSVLSEDPSATPVAGEPDSDGDGIPNNADSDIDGDGIVNGVDPDIDGDGTPNTTDGDPAATNGEVTTVPAEKNLPLPSFLPAEFNNPVGRGIIAVLILAAGVAVFAARRKRK